MSGELQKWKEKTNLKRIGDIENKGKFISGSNWVNVSSVVRENGTKISEGDKILWYDPDAHIRQHDFPDEDIPSQYRFRVKSIKITEDGEVSMMPTDVEGLTTEKGWTSESEISPKAGMMGRIPVNSRHIQDIEHSEKASKRKSSEKVS